MSGISDWEVLVVEGEADSMAVVHEILGYHHIRTHAVASPKDVLELMRQRSPTLLIVDLALPDLGSWKLIRTLRSTAETTRLPVIAVTAYHSPSVAAEALQAGFDAYFPKPLDALSFVERLEQIVEQCCR